MKSTLIINILIGLLMPFSLAARDFPGVEKLVERQAPFLKGKIIFKEVPLPTQGDTQDSYQIYSKGKKLYIEATSPTAAATAVNHYLKNYCRISLTHCVDNYSEPPTLPEVKGIFKAASPFRYRYALNYCTYNYTFSFYTWKDWEGELDWMALNGVNLMLAPMGTEILWQKTMESLGYSDKEIKDFIPGPAFNAWWLMGNMEGWGGPVSDNMIQEWKSIQQKMTVRMKELGISPILQGFWGMVPRNLKDKFPQAKVIDQGTWAGDFPRPALLMPDDPLFDQMAKVYYRYMKEYYGDNVRFMGGDLFHEGGNTAGIDIPQTAKLIQANMQKYFPESVWVLQGWGGNPKKALLDGLNPKHTMIVDLFGETQENWKTTHEYSGFPWIWATVNNFGGRVGMGAQLPKIIEEPHRAYEFSKEKHMKGMGIIPEGIQTNPVVYDWALQTAWTDTIPNPDTYLRNYLLYRYGAWNDQLYGAWNLLLKSLYGDFTVKSEGLYESIFCARPKLNITGVSFWGSRKNHYDSAVPEQALILFRQAAGQFKNSETYIYDITDLARQIVANRARPVYQQLSDAFAIKDKAALEKYCNEFIYLLKLQDALCGTHPGFMVGPWLEKAKQYGKTPEDSRLCEYNARAQITFWGPDYNPKTNLRDYSNREWNGLLADLHLRRWEAFFKDLKSQLDGNPPANIDYFAMELGWVKQTNTYPTEPQGNYLEEVDKVIALIIKNSFTLTASSFIFGTR